MARLPWFCSVFLAVFASAATAADYPNRPIRIVVPFTAGSASDFLARQIGPKLNEAWGQQVVVDNRPGAGSTLGAAIVASATPDGHTLLLNSSALAGAASIYPKLPYDTIKDLSGVSLVASNPLVLVVHPSIKARSVKELIALARSQPGKLTYASSGIGSGTHYGNELFRYMAKIETVHVPFRGTPESITDTVAGRTNYAMPPILAVLPMVKEARLIPLAVTTRARAPLLPDLPTVEEAGLPGYEYDGWFGVLAPSKTPRTVIGKLNKEIASIVEMPDIQKRIAAQGGRARSSTPEEFDRIVRTEIETRTKVFKAAGTQAN
ncbi:MAG: tripartite tricarboxylate transporter substrate binding protein [Burkholderiales bacterium]|nr:tripartite tricarboxylate transporter substrate binding protein [Burkholderiales bacterium]